MPLMLHLSHKILSYLFKLLCDALRDLVPFIQFKKREKHPWRSVTFSKAACRLKPATLLKVTLLYSCFARFLNCTNVTKSRKAFHIWRNDFSLIVCRMTGNWNLSTSLFCLLNFRFMIQYVGACLIITLRIWGGWVSAFSLMLRDGKQRRLWVKGRNITVKKNHKAFFCTLVTRSEFH